MRLQKYLAACGVSSRRGAEQLIEAGEVLINDRVARLGDKVNLDTDIIYYKGKALSLIEEKIYLMLNKPTGYITSAKDQFGRKTVLDLVKTASPVYPIGRLDYHTSGLLLLTNDGDLAYQLTHPKHEMAKTYVVKVEGRVSDPSIAALNQGVMIDEDYLTKPAQAAIISRKGNETTLSLTIREGRNRQVRKMMTAIDHEVVALKRVSVGTLTLENLPVGKYRTLTLDELNALKGTPKFS